MSIQSLPRVLRLHESLTWGTGCDQTDASMCGKEESGVDKAIVCQTINYPEHTLTIS